MPVFHFPACLGGLLSSCENSHLVSTQALKSNKTAFSAAKCTYWNLIKCLHSEFRNKHNDKYVCLMCIQFSSDMIAAHFIKISMLSLRHCGWRDGLNVNKLSCSHVKSKRIIWSWYTLVVILLAFRYQLCPQSPSDPVYYTVCSPRNQLGNLSCSYVHSVNTHRILSTWFIHRSNIIIPNFQIDWGQLTNQDRYGMFHLLREPAKSPNRKNSWPTHVSTNKPAGR